MENNLIQTLSQFLEEGIPKGSKVPKTFFDIGGFGHRENIISNFYAYFLDPAENHGLKSIFFDSLLKLINEKTTFSKNWSNWDVQREVMIQIGNSTGKVDLWIEETEEARKVILIENKVYHDLTNDLKGYLESVDLEVHNKLGILLTVQPTRIKIKNFINITHSEWIKLIRTQVDLNSLNERQAFIFNDFCKNFKTHVKHSKAMIERHLFYLKTGKKSRICLN